VNYQAFGKTYNFENIIQIQSGNGSFMRPGDSGSLLVDSQSNVVGLCFANFNNGDGLAFPIDVVLAAVGGVLA
jgi:S1-C subfamily serine protease